MNLDEVVGEVRQGNGRDMVLNLFREGVGQSSEPACSHPNAQVMPLDIAGIDVLRVRLADDSVTLAPKANSGAVALLRAFGYAIDLDQHCVVHIATESLINGLDVHLQAVACKLDAIRQTARKVFDKIAGALGIALADQPAWYQLGIGVNRSPEPRIPRAGIIRCNLWGHVLLLGVAKGPALINLHPFAFEVLENPVLVLGAKRADLEDQPHDGLFRHAGYANGGADAVPFDQAANYLGALFGSEPVHTLSMPDGSRIVKTFGKYLAKNLGGDQDALRLAQRALAAFRALRRRCSGVMAAARAFPPSLPPSRPSSDRICDRSDLGGSAGCCGSDSSSGGRSPNNLCTAIKPAWTSSSGSLPDGLRIRYQRGTSGGHVSSLWKTKVAHYRAGSRIGLGV